GTPRNVWAGTVDGLETHGDRVRVDVAGPVPVVAAVTPAAVAALDLGRGGTVWVSVKASEVDLYPA
ncbi:MAG: TOBE domain-containing protein, partial [Actinomycetota bacterium]|nr:TOBE domain-containing protein [Actinomycetota bacterium]